MAAVIITSLHRCHKARVEMTTPRCVRKRVKRFVSIYVKGPVLPVSCACSRLKEHDPQLERRFANGSAVGFISILSGDLFGHHH